MSEEERKMIEQLKALCDVWFKCGGNMIAYNQDQVHCLYGYIIKLQQENSQLKEDIKGFEQERQTLYNTIHDLQKANKQLNRKGDKE